MVPAFPATDEPILVCGHEVGHHSWCHEVPMGHSDDHGAELFEPALDALDAHVAMAGHKPRCCRARTGPSRRP
ncbi:hypothetical protein C357_19975 [Citreicella sp. 357]|nr:hypothetical protein C357_19975 [Citreicella sp. 357]